MSPIEHKKDDREGVAASVVVIAMSAGGLMPLRTLVRCLPPEFPGAVLIAQHVSTITFLPEILTRDTPLCVKLAEQSERVQPRTIYVCPAQRHISLNPDATIALSFRERVNFHRLNADWLFRSAAASFGERAAAVVLSGMRSDGSDGIVDVAEAGGLVIVQEPSTCDAPDMPRAAINTGVVNLVLEPSRIAAALSQFVTTETLQRDAAAWEAPFGFASDPLRY